VNLNDFCARFFNKGRDEIEKQQSFIDSLGQQLKDIKHAQNQEKTRLVDLQTKLKNSMTGYKEVHGAVDVMTPK